jgi:hypothetical protein
LHPDNCFELYHTVKGFWKTVNTCFGNLYQTSASADMMC